MEGVTVTVGHSPIPSFGGGAYGAPPGSGPVFAASSDLVSIAQEALQRYQAATDTAQAQCDDRAGFLQRALDWTTGSTATVSICNAAAQMKTNLDAYTRIVNDSSSSDDQIAQVLTFIDREINIHDLVDLAAQTNASTVLYNAVTDAPGAVVGWAGNAAGAIGGNILANIPWWVYVLGGVYAAEKLGLLKRLRRA